VHEGADGYGSQWRRVRNAYIREHPRCETSGCDRPAQEVHHLDHRGPLAPRGLDWSNLQALCVPCHRKLTRAREKQLRTAQAVADGKQPTPRRSTRKRQRPVTFWTAVQLVVNDQD
jgi:5-methylcytosine-specific restriction endonuclease McrA